MVGGAAQRVRGAAVGRRWGRRSRPWGIQADADEHDDDFGQIPPGPMEPYLLRDVFGAMPCIFARADHGNK